MTNVIAFHPNRGRDAAGPAVQGNVKILFFTGVRYVREAEVERDTPAAPEIGPQPKDAAARGQTGRKQA
jgi:hypothetical protein